MTKSDYLADLRIIIADAKYNRCLTQQRKALDEFYVLERDGFDLNDSDTHNAFTSSAVRDRLRSVEIGIYEPASSKNGFHEPDFINLKVRGGLLDVRGFTFCLDLDTGIATMLTSAAATTREHRMSLEVERSKSVDCHCNDIWIWSPIY